MSQRHRVSLALAISVILLLAQLASVPALSDPVAGAVPPSLHLETPWLYFVLAPVFSLWDGVSMLSMSRLKGLLLGLAAMYVVLRAATMWRAGRFSWLRELRALALSMVLFGGFVILGMLWHRPMLSLAGVDPRHIVVDFHSHTNASHDVRSSLMRRFTADANQRWHARAGFDAVFITDHNTTRGLGASFHSVKQPFVCPGIEISAWRAHIVLLGNRMPIERGGYKASLDSLFSLLQTSDSMYKALSVASLPEYRRNHWNRLDQLIAAGLDGFEIVNAAPTANEITQAERDSVIALARLHNRFVVGVSDTHGWGATSMVWNLVPVSGGKVSEDICDTVLRQLRTGFPAVRIVERHRLRPDAWWPMWLTPVGVVWETWRSMGWGLALSWFVWTWALTWGLGRTRRVVANSTRPPSAGRS
jgi:hypothetical protein